jgi:hypothetical protein
MARLTLSILAVRWSAVTSEVCCYSKDGALMESTRVKNKMVQNWNKCWPRTWKTSQWNVKRIMGNMERCDISLSLRHNAQELYGTNSYSSEFCDGSGVPLETCWALNERWNNKFCYKVASSWLFLLNLWQEVIFRNTAFFLENKATVIAELLWAYRTLNLYKNVTNAVSSGRYIPTFRINF